VEPSPHHQHEC
jgi:hypothetical protein